jgi:hypothetical protein
LPQASISFTLDVKAQQVPAFQYTALIVRNITQIITRRVSQSVLAQLFDPMHDVGGLLELGDNISVSLAAI